MSYPLDNLGDYNVARTDLKKFGGDIAKLYDHIGKTAVEKERPYIMMQGGIAVLGILGVAKLCKLGYDSYKKRRTLIKNEPALKEEFMHKMQKISDDCSDDIVPERSKEEQECENQLSTEKSNN